MFEARSAPISVVQACRIDTGFTPTAYPAAPARLPDAEIVDPYARGLQDGEQIARAAQDAEIAHLNTLLAATSALQNSASDDLAALIAETVERLVTDIAGSVAIDRERMMERIAAAVSVIAECDAARTLWLHPDDAALIDPDTVPLTIGLDPAAPRGSVRIACAEGSIEHGTGSFLDALRIQLGRTGEEK